MRNKRPKIAIIGAGFTGATTAFMLAQKELGDIVLVDTPSHASAAQGKALDMSQAAPVLGFDTHIHATADYAETRGADLVIITAGIARRPGMSRSDLVNTNAEIMKKVTKEIVHYSPDCTIIVLTNPVDAMACTVYKTSGFPKARVIGQSGILDTARFRFFVAAELNVSVKDITSFVLGGHGDDMVPLIRYASVGGIPLETLLSEEQITAIVERTRHGGGEIVSLLEDGSAYYAPAAALTSLAEAILKDQRRIIPVSAYLEGEYGYDDLFLGVPTIIGRGGIEQIIELELTAEEKAAFAESAASVREMTVNCQAE